MPSSRSGADRAGGARVRRFRTNTCSATPRLTTATTTAHPGLDEATSASTSRHPSRSAAWVPAPRAAVVGVEPDPGQLRGCSAKSSAVRSGRGIQSIIDPPPSALGATPKDRDDSPTSWDMPSSGRRATTARRSSRRRSADMTVDELEARLFLRDLVGMDATDSGPESSASWERQGDEIRPVERRVLIAAGRVQRATNVPVMSTPRTVDVVLEAISCWRRMVPIRAGSTSATSTARPGGGIRRPRASIGHDCFGSTFSIDSETKMNPTDAATDRRRAGDLRRRPRGPGHDQQ